MLEIDNTKQLILEYCKKCGCELFQDNVGYVLRDGKREITIWDLKDVIPEATKLHKLHKLEEKLKDERDYKIRRKIISHLYNIESMSE